MGFRPSGVYPNPICPTIPTYPLTYRIGIYTNRTEYEMMYLSYRPYNISPIYNTLPILYLIGQGSIVYDIPTGRSTLWNRYRLSGVGISPETTGFLPCGTPYRWGSRMSQSAISQSIFTSPTLYILSVLYYLPATLQDRGYPIGYTIRPA